MEAIQRKYKASMFDPKDFISITPDIVLTNILDQLQLRHAVRTDFEVKLAEIAKLENLKILSLFLCNLDKTGPNSILALMGFLPKLQELDLNFLNCKLTEDAAKKRLLTSTTFPYFKTLRLSKVDLGNGIELSYAFQMIRSFPNLQTLEITTSYENAAPRPGICSLEVDYNTMWQQQQLQSVVFRDLKGSENEVCLIKYFLACSPFLKKIVIGLHSRLPYHTHNEKFMFATKLLKLQRASPVVDVNLY
ncbi:hypothetical protein L1987_57319 [Smallanthus sonchifolius]|uniref:Uncharacterized protein n=1 Tax=Smallanthus sonchifolius TaxID=185202 RepID=A0ACB9DCH4_9ASTR|nr:hypothetical protein L1987_87036 [Smallanthus sonchifolius]KAI3744242.1 hypothetical protein L1987_57319 [Smallanthus sonchifolius]